MKFFYIFLFWQFKIQETSPNFSRTIRQAEFSNRCRLMFSKTDPRLWYFELPLAQYPLSSDVRTCQICPGSAMDGDEWTGMGRLAWWVGHTDTHLGSVLVAAHVLQPANLTVNRQLQGYNTSKRELCPLVQLRYTLP